MDFLDQFPLEKSSHILEVGCGWGVLSCYLSKHYSGSVTGLDADKTVQHYFDFHSNRNKVQPSFVHGTMQSMTKKKLRGYDVIVGCDICFWDSLKKDWQNLIRRAHKAGVKEIYITDPGRPPFWELVDYAEQNFGADIWSHETETPYSLEQYVLELRLSD
jgi:predicted nicotinamide N-methyase